MSKPETLFEQASHDLNQFRERRMAERRAVARDTPDRRRQQLPPGDGAQQDDRGGNDASKQD
ncbi:MAG TPA: hypothetical protein VEC01_01295 [Noviherbaspirillum sp.]|uniref:hypothetical protein n=1 Tax=Noviherbaspirillum sp. TaxID=1926288 RepID=UPI002D673161|nr:hypothetical protein [Noviherbaspirillum sp.]HYD93930.1 hypothetical protein [Noviherbaspirillum sp.]